MSAPVSLSSLAPELVQRFAADLARVWRLHPAHAHHSLGLAVSGGPDSLALLLLARAVVPGRIAAATVDHGLRAESAGEAAEVARICRLLDVPHETLMVHVAPGNRQAAARRARYAALCGWMIRQNLPALATAHHADDQAETVLMRLNRGSGVAGLAGVRGRGPLPGQSGLDHARLEVIRPLLGWRRRDLARVVAMAGLIPADDSSNHNAAYDRVRLRAQLAGAEWLDIPAIAASAAHLADADAALEWAAAREWQEAVRQEGAGFVYRPGAPRAVMLRVLARIVAGLDRRREVRGAALARLLETLLTGQPASIGDLVARPGPAGWCFTHAPKRRTG